MIDQEKYSMLDAKLQEREASWERQREQAAVIRRQKENSLVENAERKRRQLQM